MVGGYQHAAQNSHHHSPATVPQRLLNDNSDRPVEGVGTEVSIHLIHFTNSCIIVGTDPPKSRMDLWARVWSRAH